MSQTFQYPEALHPEADVTTFEKTALIFPLGASAGVSMAESSPDLFIRSAPLALVAGFGTMALARMAVNYPVSPEDLPDISDAENEANIRNSKIAAIAAGAAGVASKYELTQFANSWDMKELVAGTALTGAAGLWAKVSIDKHRIALGREKLQQSNVQSENS